MTDLSVDAKQLQALAHAAFGWQLRAEVANRPPEVCAELTAAAYATMSLRLFMTMVAQLSEREPPPAVMALLDRNLAAIDAAAADVPRS